MIAIIDYQAGNIQSVKNAVEKLGYKTVLTRDKKTIQQADKVILPGVGEASSAMNNLKKYELDEFIKNIKQPLLGICLGLQLMCDFSEEGQTNGLGLFNTQVKRFSASEKVPHMGWNTLKDEKGALFNHIKPSSDVYFVHSYYAELSADSVANCDYILPFSAAMQKDNFYATQFHPEKSGSIGQQILQNFLIL